MSGAVGPVVRQPDVTAGQSASVAIFLLALGVLVHVVSWLSPVYDKTLGFEAYRACFPMIFKLEEGKTLSQILAALTPHTNYLVVAAVYLVIRKRSVSSIWAIAISLVLGLLCNLVWMSDPESFSHLKFGYYLWLCSFALIAGAAGLTTRKFRQPSD